MMAFFRHFRALMWKNAVLKRRAPVTAILEVVLPLAFICIMLGLKQLRGLAPTDHAAAEHTDDSLTVLPFSVVPARLNSIGFRLAVAPSTPGAAAAVDAFIADMTRQYQAVNFSTVGGTGMNDTLVRSVYIPGIDTVLTRFASDGALQSYIQDASYPTTTPGGSHPPIWAAIIFNSGGPAWDYSIRMNSSDVTSSSGPPVRTFLTSYYSGPLDSYVNSYPQTSGLGPVSNGGGGPMPGFTTLQLMVDRWIIQRNVSKQDMDQGELLDSIKSSLNLLGYGGVGYLFKNDWTEINAIDPARATAILDDLRTWLASETFAPQQVDIVPFPVSSYRVNLFYTIVLPILTLLFVMAFLFPVTRLIRGLVLEKEMRIRESMKIMGLSTTAHFLSWVLTYAITYLILAALIACVGLNIFPNSDPSLIMLLFLCFGLSSTTFSCLVSVFFTKSRTASVLGGILFFASYFAFFAVNNDSVGLSALAGGSILAPTALGLAIDVLGTLEGNSIGLSHATLYSPGGTSGTWSVGASMAMLIFDTVLYALIAAYADAVLPASMREVGVPRPFYFPLLPSFWAEVCGCGASCGAGSSSARPTAKQVSSSPKDESSYSPRWLKSFTNRTDAYRQHNGPPPDPTYLEQPDASLQQKQAGGRCVSVTGLRKEFSTPDGTKVAVDDVDMTMYEGQIFVLLGHNGAGKTTTISMLTGLIPATDGGATVFGRDIGSQLDQVRKELGVCPQHDVLWPELTVKEHLELFASIKGVPQAEVAKTITDAVAMVGLTEKINTRSSDLSGGMKRKLSVAIAFMGGSRVVFLDEPTSGMDPYSRRSTWQILQNAREGRVIVLTTHFMDEADILGDRIAIMANGQVKCCGSPMFLKQRFGVGYVLTCVKGRECDPQAVLDLVRSHVPEASLATNVGAELSLRMPLTSAPSFPNLLSALDESLSALHLNSYGVSVTNIEDIFLQVASDHGIGGGAKVDGVVASTGKGSESSSREDGGADLNAGDLKTGDHTPVVVANPLAAAAASNSTAAAVTPGRSTCRRNATAVLVGALRRGRRSFLAFLHHFSALFAKRAQYARRDYRAMCCMLLVPIVLLIAGIGFIAYQSRTEAVDYMFTTNDFNKDIFASSGDSPRYPNYVPAFTFKSSGATDNVTLAAGPGLGAVSNTSSVNITSLLSSMPSQNISFDGGKLLFNPLQAVAIDAEDPFGFVTSEEFPMRDWQRMSSFLLSDKKNYAASKYGAIVFTRDGTILGSSGQDATTTLPYSSAATYSAMVNTTAVHAAPVFINLMSNALYRASVENTAPWTEAVIRARNHPLPYTSTQLKYILSGQSAAVVQVIIIAMAFVPASFIMFAVKEREVGAKHQQVVSGVSLPAYWLAAFAWDSLSYILPAALAVIVVSGFNVGVLTSSTLDRLPALILSILLYGPSSASFCYVLSHAFKSHSTAQAGVVMVNIISFGGVLTMFALSNVDDTCSLVPAISHALRLLPLFSMGNALFQTSIIDILPTAQYTCDASNGRAKDPSAYPPYTSALDLDVAGYGLLYMAVTAFVYLGLALALDVALSNPRLRQILDRAPAVTDKPYDVDEDVAAEATRVAQEQGSRTSGDVIVLDRIRKVYSGGKVAVKSLSYGIPSGEVFGFLGINGAGKTSALKILTGDQLPTSGTAKLAGFDIISQQRQVRRLLGYCPQFDALLDLLTAREHLELYGRIKGIHASKLKSIVNQQLKDFDLVQYANKLAGTLSGGNKRKLSVAIALMGSPPLVFLDEPSTGVDPVARRFMWSIISKVATEQKQCSIILTTHSMEEVEALCTRIGIMVGGRLRCLGTAQHLRDRHGQGYVSQVRLHQPPINAIDAILQSMRQALHSGHHVSHAPHHDGDDDSATFAGIERIAVSLGKPYRCRELTSGGSGWALAATLESSSSKTVSLRDLAVWWAEEDAVESLCAFFQGSAFPGSQVVERQGLQVKLSIPPQACSPAQMFRLIEGARQYCGIATYTLGQTTLEQVFNTFAAQQDEEKGVARGIVSAPPPPGAVVVANPLSQQQRYEEGDVTTVAAVNEDPAAPTPATYVDQVQVDVSAVAGPVASRRQLAVAQAMGQASGRAAMPPRPTAPAVDVEASSAPTAEEWRQGSKK